MIFHFNTRVLLTKFTLYITYLKVFVLFWALFSAINHIHRKLATFTLWLRDHKLYSRNLKYFYLQQIFILTAICFDWLLVQDNVPSVKLYPLNYILQISNFHFTNENYPDSWDANLIFYWKFCRKYIPSFLQVKIKSKLPFILIFC